MTGGPTREAADLVRRYLVGRGRRDAFQLYDVEPFTRWLAATGLRGRWDDCRRHHGGEAELLAAVRAETPS